MTIPRSLLSVLPLLLVGSCSRCGSSSSARPEPIARPDPPEAGAVVVVAVDASDERDASRNDGSVEACGDVDTDAEKRFHAWDEARSHGWAFDEPHAHRSVAPDLDGDGIGEIEWTFIDPPQAAQAHIYRGGACPMVHLATLATGGLKPESKVHDGHTDFLTEDFGSFCEGSPCGCTPEVRHYTWSGKEYREDPSRRTAGRINPCEDAP